MDDVPLILTGGDFSNDYCIISRGPMLASFTWRGWAGMVADWAKVLRRVVNEATDQVYLSQP